MDERRMEPVELERVRLDATSIITRIGLGNYELQGGAENVLVPESRVAWATVAHQLEAEGYRMVEPEEYAAETGLRAGEVTDLIDHGKLFALVLRNEVLVPLPEKEAVFEPMEVPGEWPPAEKSAEEGSRPQL